MVIGKERERRTKGKGERKENVSRRDGERKGKEKWKRKRN